MSITTNEVEIDVCTVCGSWVCDNCGAIRPRVRLDSPPTKCGHCSNTEGHFAPTRHRGGSAAFHDPAAKDAKVSASVETTTNGTTTVAIGGPDIPEVPELDFVSSSIASKPPYAVRVRIRGSSPLLFHRWQSEVVKEHADAPKGSDIKKTDDVESYVWRDEDGIICLPGEYLRQSIVGRRAGAAKYRQDPRNKRQQMTGLMQASLLALTELAPMYSVTEAQAATWDYLDERRAVVNNGGVSRTRPAFLAGWTAQVDLLVLQPGYVDERLLLDLLIDAGKFVAVADYRPRFGRFQVVNFERLKEIPA